MIKRLKIYLGLMERIDFVSSMIKITSHYAYTNIPVYFWVVVFFSYLSVMVRKITCSISHLYLGFKDLCTFH